MYLHLLLNIVDGATQIVRQLPIHIRVVQEQTSPIGDNLGKEGRKEGSVSLSLRTMHPFRVRCRSYEHFLVVADISFAASLGVVISGHNYGSCFGHGCRAPTESGLQPCEAILLLSLTVPCIFF